MVDARRRISENVMTVYVSVEDRIGASLGSMCATELMQLLDRRKRFARESFDADTVLPLE